MPKVVTFPNLQNFACCKKCFEDNVLAHNDMRPFGGQSLAGNVWARLGQNPLTGWTLTGWKQMVPCQGGSPCPYSKVDMLDCPGTKLTQSRVTSVPSPMGLQHRAEARGVTGSNSLPIVWQSTEVTQIPQTESPQEVQGFVMNIPSPKGSSDDEISQLWRGGMGDLSFFWYNLRLCRSKTYT